MTTEDTISPLPEWPEYGLVEDLLPTLTRWTTEGRRAALATLVGITGSSPRPMGSEMVIADNGEVAGYVSGGCVEAAVMHEALASLADGLPRTLDYGAGSPVLDIQLTCGGRITIFVRAITDLSVYVSRLSEARKDRRALTVLTNLKTGEMRFSDAEHTAAASGDFAKLHEPPTRLILAGGDPVTLAILKLARSMDMETILLRPLGPEQGPPGLSAASYDRRNLDRAFEKLLPDRWTAVYTLTHDAFTDLRIAEYALKSAAFCVGILGSRRKIASRVDALRKAGIPDATLKRLHLPAGIEIGARSPVEIAVSILAQITASRNATLPQMTR